MCSWLFIRYNSVFFDYNSIKTPNCISSKIINVLCRNHATLMYT